MEYDFKLLSDYEFELLCGDLLGAMLGQPLEHFRKGRDGGIDLRYAPAGDGSTIVQCKHYANTPFSGLHRTVAAERGKLEALRPGRYLLATSHFFTPKEKEELFQLLQSFCKSTGDILGGGELNALLRQYPQVERAHYKLWLTSTEVLQRILHSGVCQQSEFLRTEIEDKLKLYVQSQSAYRKAREILHAHNCCVISGIPGIGKTTLAEILLIHYLEQGYEIVKIRADIGEALQAYRAGEKQVFLYDDFLGATALESGKNKNEGRDLLSFMGRIARQKGKKFILTTREYILNQAKQTMEEFARQNFDLNKCIISLADYTRADRARILYNHLYFYEVPRAYIEDLLEEDRVLDIIGHPNYSPRLIESAVDLLRPQDSGQFYRFFMETLDHPNKLWEHSFCRRISPAARDLLLLMYSFSRRSLFLDELGEQYQTYHRQAALAENRSLAPTDFMDALREAEGTFLSIDRGMVSYHNPSVQDFIQDYVQRNDGVFRLLCQTAGDFGQCRKLADCALLEGGRLFGLHRDAVVEMVCRTLSPEKFSVTDRGEELSALLPFIEQVECPELDEVVVNFIRDWPALLEKEARGLTKENWGDRDAPRDLRRILELFLFSEFRGGLGAEHYQAALAYGAAWFSLAYTYWEDDFLLFPFLFQHQPFSYQAPELRPVHQALLDYRDELAEGSVWELDSEDECWDYLGDIRRLENFFGVDFAEVKDAVEERIGELQDEAEEEDEEGYDAPEAGDLADDREILDMFRGLLSREPGEGGEACGP